MKAGLRALSANIEAVLFTLVDQPMVKVETYQALAERYPLHPDMAQFRAGVVEWTQSRLPDGSLTRP